MRNSHSIIVSRRLKAQSPDDAFVEVTIYAPTDIDAGWECQYRIQASEYADLLRSAVGEDSVQSLLLALWQIELQLAYKEPFKSLKLEKFDKEGYGFIHSPKVWNSVYSDNDGGQP